MIIEEMEGCVPYTSVDTGVRHLETWESACIWVPWAGKQSENCNSHTQGKETRLFGKGRVVCHIPL